MMTGKPSPEAQLALHTCAELVARLHKMCCEPDRSPTMAGLESAIATIETEIASGDAESLARSVERLDHIGATIGRLQIGCCAPARMPLYAEVLSQLNAVHLAISGEMHSPPSPTDSAD